MNHLKRSKVIGAMAICLLLGALIAGCAKSSENAASSSPAATAVQATAAPTVAPTPEPRGKITVAVYDRGNMPQGQGTIDKNWATDWLNQNGPEDVQFVPIPRWTDTAKYNVLFASGSAPDLIWSYDANFKNQLMSQNELLPLDDLIDKYSTTYKKLLQDNPGLKKVSTAADGHIYQIGRVNGYSLNQIMLIRKDWLDKLNLPVPQTTDDLLNVARAFTRQDPDGDSKADTHGIALSFGSGYMINYMFGFASPIVVDGKIEVNPWEREQADAAFQKQMFDEGLVDKDFLNDKDGSKAKQDFETGKVGIYSPSSWEEDTLTALLKNEPNADVISIPLPKTQFGQFSPVLSPVQVVGAVNAKAKDPVAVMKYIDFISDPKNMTYLNFGDEGTDYAMVNGCPALKDAQNPKLSFTGDINMLYSPGIFGKCGNYVSTLNTESNPVDKKWAEIYQEAEHNYISADRPYAGIMSSELYPSLPSDLQTINASVATTMYNDFYKSIVSGSAYTPEMMITELKDMWSKAGGQQIDDWWQEWYDANKDTAYLTPDIYKN